MKLYTEEQVIHAIKMARSSYNIFTTPFIYNKDEVLQQLTPIELPSDEEIDKYARQSGLVHPFVERGAKWMRNLIQGGNK